MAIRMEIKGLDAAIKNVSQVASNVKKDVQGELTAFGFDVEQRAKQRVASNSSDEGALLNSVSTKPGNLEVTVVAAIEYAAFIEFGTRKFAESYVSSLPSEWKQYASQFRGKGGDGDFMTRLLGWMKRKGIDEALAYPIARKIMTYGIKQKPFLYPSIQEALPELNKRLKEIFK